MTTKHALPDRLATTAPPVTVLFDGACPFCTRSALTIQRIFGDRRVTLRDIQAEGALVPSVTRDAALKKMHIVMPDGRVFAGAEAFARILMLWPVLGWLGWLYYVPGARQMADGLYAVVAQNRYRLFGRVCDGDACRVQTRSPR